MRKEYSTTIEVPRGFPTVLVIICATLKYFGILNTSWFWVFTPYYAVILLYAFMGWALMRAIAKKKIFISKEPPTNG